MPPVISRVEARASGLKRFFTGAPCQNGHSAERLVSNGFCVECRRRVWEKFKNTHPERVAENKAIQNERSTKNGYFSDYYAKNAEKRKAQSRHWYDANKKRALDAQKDWCRDNPDRVRELSRLKRRARRARLAGADGTHTRQDLENLFAAQRGRCALCRTKLMPDNAEVDHIVPLARGGSNGANNLQYLCLPCNRAKGSKDPIDFARAIGMLV